MTTLGMLTVLVATVVGLLNWHLARRWRAACQRWQKVARDLDAALDDVSEQRDDLGVRLGIVRATITRRPPRRKWLALCHRVGNIADTRPRRPQLVA